MKQDKLSLSALLVSAWTITALPVGAVESAELEQLQRQLEAQQQEIERLQRQDETLERRLGATADYVEKSAAKGAGRGSTTLGGYGELHYNDLENQVDNSSSRTIDFHRFVLFIGHEFSPRIRLYSELELEHALVKDTQCSGVDGTDNASGPEPDEDITLVCGDTAPGEVELEQAYIEADLSQSLSIKGGVFLLPVGILNETHEPPTFYGVERNPVEKNIIPSTWWEGGLGISGRIGKGLSYDLAYHSGLAVPSSSYSIRSGRQKVAEADGQDWATTARLKWTGMRGLELAVSGQYQQDITQGTDSSAGSASLLASHIIWQAGPLGLRALYAQWNLAGDGPKNAGHDEQTGYYIEPAIKIMPQLGVFARYNVWDNQAGDNVDSEYKQTDVGINYWPHEDVVIKLDYQNQDSPVGKKELDGLNVGIGYQF